MVHKISFSGLETDWGVSEELIALLVDFLISEATLHDSLLSDSFILLCYDVLSLIVFSVQELLFMIGIIGYLLPSTLVFFVPLNALVHDVLLLSAGISHLLVGF